VIDFVDSELKSARNWLVVANIVGRRHVLNHQMSPTYLF